MPFFSDENARISCNDTLKLGEFSFKHKNTHKSCEYYYSINNKRMFQVNDDLIIKKNRLND